MTSLTNSAAVGALVERHRKASRRSKRDVAREAGVDIATFIRLEQGHYATPSPITLRGVAKALGIPVLELFAAAAYVTPDDLTEMAEYTRTTNTSLPGEAENQLDAMIARTIEEHGIDYDGPLEEVS